MLAFWVAQVSLMANEQAYSDTGKGKHQEMTWERELEKNQTQPVENPSWFGYTENSPVPQL